MVNRRKASNIHIQFGRTLCQVRRRFLPCIKGMTSKRYSGRCFKHCCSSCQRAKRNSIKFDQPSLRIYIDMQNRRDLLNDVRESSFGREFCCGRSQSMNLNLKK